MSVGQTEIRNSSNKKECLCVWNMPQDDGVAVCCLQFAGLEVDKCFQGVLTVLWQRKMELIWGNQL